MKEFNSNTIVSIETIEQQKCKEYKLGDHKTFNFSKWKFETSKRVYFWFCDSEGLSIEEFVRKHGDTLTVDNDGVFYKKPRILITFVNNNVHKREFDTIDEMYDYANIIKQSVNTDWID